MTRPLGDTAEDAERWWQAYQLAEDDRAGELREPDWQQFLAEWPGWS